MFWEGNEKYKKRENICQEKILKKLKKYAKLLEMEVLVRWVGRLFEQLLVNLLTAIMLFMSTGIC